MTSTNKGKENEWKKKKPTVVVWNGVMDEVGESSEKSFSWRMVVRLSVGWSEDVRLTCLCVFYTLNHSRENTWKASR